MGASVLQDVTTEAPGAKSSWLNAITTTGLGYTQRRTVGKPVLHKACVHGMSHFNAFRRNVTVLSNMPLFPVL